MSTSTERSTRPPGRARAVVAGLLLATLTSWALPPVALDSLIVGRWVWPTLLIAAALAVAVRGRALRTPAVVLAVLMLPVVLFTAATTRVMVLGTDATGTDPAGCRVVGSESSFLMGAGGSLGTVSRGIHLVHLTSQYGADDGERPLTEHEYDIAWQTGVDGRRAAVVTLMGSQPVWPTTHVLSCP